MKRIRARGGFTLIEVLVAVAVMMILLVGVLAIFAPLYRFFGQAKQTAQAKSIADTAYTMIAERVKLANELWANETGTGAHAILIGADAVEADDYTLGGDFFAPYTIAVHMTFARPKVTGFYIEVFNASGERIYQTEPTALTLRNFSSGIEGADAKAFPSGDFINPQLYYNEYAPAT